MPKGPVDIVGDVHGDRAGLDALLRRLGYGPDGRHGEGRRLVFVGDLVDRGPDSVGVFERVRGLVDGGHECLLGNHELNLLLGLRRHGNDWFWALPDPAPYLEFFAARPLALEREDLRVVHACWDGVERLRTDLDDLFDSVRGADAAVERALVDKVAAAAAIRDALDERPDGIDDTYVEVTLARQTASAVRLTTSGPEERADAPFHAGGRWRMLQRSRWWRRHHDPTPIVFGHYHRTHRGPQDPFDDEGPFDWLGPQQSAFCVDYTGRVAALRVPEWRLVFEDGHAAELGAPSHGGTR